MSPELLGKLESRLRVQTTKEDCELSATAQSSPARALCGLGPRPKVLLDSERHHWRHWHWFLCFPTRCCCSHQVSRKNSLQSPNLRAINALDSKSLGHVVEPWPQRRQKILGGGLCLLSRPAWYGTAQCKEGVPHSGPLKKSNNWPGNTCLSRKEWPAQHKALCSLAKCLEAVWVVTYPASPQFPHPQAVLSQQVHSWDCSELFLHQSGWLLQLGHSGLSPSFLDVFHTAPLSHHADSWASGWKSWCGSQLHPLQDWENASCSSLSPAILIGCQDNQMRGK